MSKADTVSKTMQGKHKSHLCVCFTAMAVFSRFVSFSSSELSLVCSSYTVCSDAGDDAALSCHLKPAIMNGWTGHCEGRVSLSLEDAQWECVFDSQRRQKITGVPLYFIHGGKAITEHIPILDACIL